MKKLGMEIGDFDLIEANEAFAAQSVAVGKDLGFDLSKLNVNGEQLLSDIRLAAQVQESL